MSTWRYSRKVTKPSLSRQPLWAVWGLVLALAGCGGGPVAPPARPPAAAGKGTQAATADRAERGAEERRPRRTGAGPVDLARLEPAVEGFCGACHATPNPQSFPRKFWHEEVNRGFNLFFQSGRSDLIMPPVSDVVDYFREQAPDRLEFVAALEAGHPSPFRFRAEPIVPEGATEVPGVAYVTLRDIRSAGGPRLFSCDMATGVVESREVRPGVSNPLMLGRLPQPAHIEPVDFNGDGVEEFVVAALGSYQPGDHDRGQVCLLRPKWSGGQQPAVEVLMGGLGRVADVRPADFDGDGDLDLVVGEFGFIKTGRVLLLENRGPAAGTAGGTPEFVLHELDDRHGTIHVPVCDLNGDGRPDFVALISQDHETIVAFINQGGLKFEKQTLFSGGDPAFGSNGIELVDFDGDGDLDVLATNGDTLDSKFLKPYHGLRWLENTGSFPWTPHEIGRMPGVSRALSGDFDGDGDLDVFAIAFFPGNLRKLDEAPQLESAVVFENLGGDQFARHRLETGNLEHMCLEVADLEGDGDLDAVIGHCASNPTDSPVGKPCLTIWRNLRIDDQQTADRR